ncbi:SRPBCC family protein [Paracoccus sp. TK19116]|uniref:SRPBCC family protein n=1 Tax=Paracoccus albicereus TaxID=2922394 RepID=A0ABT1MT58_9RHOB|nr:SRPBCC family protein [Paracoccus albicereus]MCQ0970051.1 SRPBCC family protein [Paracoccus albicereus]
MKTQTKVDGNDLILIRHIAASPEAIWDALTDAEKLKQWFVPKPWTITEAVIEPRPGGRFLTKMVGPNGENEDCGPSEGCVLEADAPSRIVWTDALSGGYRPNETPFMTAIMTMEADGNGTLYTARALHRTPEDRQKHEEMGFAEGWGTVAEQLAAMVER